MFMLTRGASDGRSIKRENAASRLPSGRKFSICIALARPPSSEYQNIYSSLLNAQWICSASMLTVLAFSTSVLLALPVGFAQQPTSGLSVAAIQTAVPQPVAPLDGPSPFQASLPPKQSWCPSEIYCAGSVSKDFQIYIHVDLTNELSKSYSKQSTLHIYMTTTRCL